MKCIVFVGIAGDWTKVRAMWGIIFIACQLYDLLNTNQLFLYFLVTNKTFTIENYSRFVSV